ncbi:hypothetical protein Q1695_010627 [Nippostrongylus brasiliensis]|nr:hypothetical protein Q1695_010627 [Nippostrongylus brasiliensis]
MPFLSLPTLSAKPSVGRSEYGRVKVALPPGKGLMDWVRIASGKILAKKRMSVDHDELMKHNTREDCWIHIFGQVYDVTTYLEFHPGGIPELMRAAGTDATDLFNQFHAWVNYENMLKSCLVGRFTGDLSKLPQPGPSTTGESQSISAQLNALIMKGKQTGSETYGISIEKKEKSLKLRSDKWNSSNLGLANVLVDVSASKKHIRLVIRAYGQSGFEVKWEDVPLDSETPTYTVSVFDGYVWIKFDTVDIESALSTSKHQVRQSPLVSYHECTVEEKRQVSRDTILLVLRLPEGLYFPVALGKHVSFKVRKGASVLYRPYTPIGFGSLPERFEDFERVSCTGAAKLTFMIKIYEQGICTPSLEKLNIGDSIEFSEPIGNIDLSPWTSPKFGLLMLAAGTGLTPMVNIISARLLKSSDEGLDSSSTELLLFNKSEEDIVSDDWLPMKWTDERMKIEHILSAPSEKWSGRVGRITAQMLPESQDSLRVLICGPDGFIATASKLLQDAGYRKENVHVFQG